MTTADTSVTSAGRQRADDPEWVPAAIVFCAGLGVRLWLIHIFPVIFGGDSIVRLANKDRILLSYQLPLLQAAVHGISALSNNPAAVRYFMALAGALAGLAFYALACSLLGRTAALQAALLFASSPFVVAFSIVPYQEILMLAGLFAAFYFAFEGNWLAASVTLGLACMTRYEAWPACPVIGVAFLLEKGFRPVEIAKAALLFGWAPLGWIAFQGGVTPQGTYAAEASFSFERFFRWVYLAWITVKNTPPPVLLLALFGAWMFWKRRLIDDRRYQLLLGFLVLFLVAVLLSAHGERDQPERFVTAREAHILLAATVLLAGVGLASSEANAIERHEESDLEKAEGTGYTGSSSSTGTGNGWRKVAAYRWPFVLGSYLVGVWMAYGFVANEAGQPAFVLSFEAARYLDEQLAAGESAVVLAKPVPRDLLMRHLDKAEHSGGSAAREKALAMLLELDTSPPNYQRILVHSRLTKQQLRSVATLPKDLMPAVIPSAGSPNWLVLWSDFEPANDVEQTLLDEIVVQPPDQIFERDDMLVAIFRLR